MHTSKIPRIETLSEFSDSIRYGSCDLLDLSSFNVQSLLLDHLIQMLSGTCIDQRNYHELLVHPNLEDLYLNLCQILDSQLEIKASFIFELGGDYVSNFIGNSGALSVVRQILSQLGKTFPNLKATLYQKLNLFLSVFFDSTIGEFFDKYTLDVSSFSFQFPNIYRLFISPLTLSSHHAKKLFNFYCNPYVYWAIMDFLTNQDRSQRLSEYLYRLERRLMLIDSRCGEKSRQVVADKILRLLESADDLESFAVQCAGVVGEINTAAYSIESLCEQEDSIIFLEDANKNKKKKREKNCDLMIVHKNLEPLGFIEVKTKIPRHGVAQDDLGMWDDFFTNFFNPISTYINYLNCHPKIFKKLNLRKYFPLLFSHEGSNYGTALPLVQMIIRYYASNEQITPLSLALRWKSQKKIETVLQAFFMEPLILTICCAPIPNDDVRTLIRKRLITDLLQKDWLINTFNSAINQLIKTYERLSLNGSKVTMLYVALDLSLSYRLLYDPLSYSDEDMKIVANEELQKIFEEFCKSNIKEGVYFRLILP